MSAFTILNQAVTGPFVFSCEHASNRLPDNIECTPTDQHFLETHWGWDIGAESVTRHLIESTQSQGILATHSRLWVDLNRSLERQDLFRRETEGHQLTFNAQLTAEEGEQRLENFYKPFHDAYDDLVKERAQKEAPVVLISIHSFTPVWDGAVRTMDIGVLFDECEGLGVQLASLLQDEELFVETNAPYTGRGGLMYSVEDKGKRNSCPHLELEINQALICTPERQRFIADKIHRALLRLNEIER